jgi:SAM-dependent methyltransferase
MDELDFALIREVRGCAAEPSHRHIGERRDRPRASGFEALAHVLIAVAVPLMQLPDLDPMTPFSEGTGQVGDDGQNARSRLLAARHDVRDPHGRYSTLPARSRSGALPTSFRMLRPQPTEDEAAPNVNPPGSVTVVVPAYDVHAAIAPIVRDLGVAAYALRTRAIELDVLILDGGGHEEAAIRSAKQVGLRLSVVRGPLSGPGEAYARGLIQVASEGRSDLVATLDANGRHDPTEIPRLIDHLVQQNVHVVIGSRWTAGSGTPGMSLSRWLLGRLANLAFRFVASARGITDGTTSFRVARTEIVPSLNLAAAPADTYSVHTRFVANAIAYGFRVGEAPIIYRPPIAGAGGLGLRDVGEFASHLLALRRDVRRVRHHRLSPAGRDFPIEHFGAQDDLERLGASKHFFDWVLDEFQPHLRGRVLEVGAGAGTITRRLLERYPDLTVVALEPAENMFVDLEAYAALEPRATARRSTLAEYLPDPSVPFDAVIYLNVLEHIADDGAEIRMAADSLRSGGALLVFGPAHEMLYSELDHKAGHYRRYSTSTLRRLVEQAGLHVATVRYFDPLGVLPYLVAYRWLRRPAISGSTVWGYDRMIVPISRLSERLLPRPRIGKNILLVGVKD